MPSDSPRPPEPADPERLEAENKELREVVAGLIPISKALCRCPPGECGLHPGLPTCALRGEGSQGLMTALAESAALAENRRQKLIAAEGKIAGHVCAVRESLTCVWLADGTKVEAKREPEARGKMWLEVKRQASIVPASVPAPTPEPVGLCNNPNHPGKHRLMGGEACPNMVVSGEPEGEVPRAKTHADECQSPTCKWRPENPPSAPSPSEGPSAKSCDRAAPVAMAVGQLLLSNPNPMSPLMIEATRTIAVALEAERKDALRLELLTQARLYNANVGLEKALRASESAAREAANGFVRRGEEIVTLETAVESLTKERDEAVTRNKRQAAIIGECPRCIMDALSEDGELAERLTLEVDLVEARAQLSAARQEREKLAEEVARLKGLIDRDRTGLAEALDACRKEIRSRWWIAAGEWGSYEWHERTEKTFRAEVSAAFEAIESIAVNALAESGRRANAAFNPSAEVAAALRVPPSSPTPPTSPPKIQHPFEGPGDFCNYYADVDAPTCNQRRADHAEPTSPPTEEPSPDPWRFLKGDEPLPAQAEHWCEGRNANRPWSRTSCSVCNEDKPAVPSPEPPRAEKEKP
jgi:hypothetical protein